MSRAELLCIAVQCLLAPSGPSRHGGCGARDSHSDTFNVMLGSVSSSVGFGAKAGLFADLLACCVYCTRVEDRSWDSLPSTAPTETEAGLGMAEFEAREEAMVCLNDGEEEEATSGGNGGATAHGS